MAGELHHPSRTAASPRLPGTPTLSVASRGHLIDSADYYGRLRTRADWLTAQKIVLGRPCSRYGPGGIQSSSDRFIIRFQMWF